MKPPTPDERPDDFHVEYHWSAGTMPPPHHYEYTITIEPSGLGKMVLIPDYPRDEVPRWTEPFTIEPEALDALYNVMVENGLFTRTWRQKDDPPVGGSAQWMVVVADGRHVEVKTYPVVAQEAAAEEIYSAVRGLVPSEVWKRLHALRDEYRRNWEQDS